MLPGILLSDPLLDAGDIKMRRSAFVHGGCIYLLASVGLLSNRSPGRWGGGRLFYGEKIACSIESRSKPHILREIMRSANFRRKYTENNHFIKPAVLAGFLSTGHNLESSERREPQSRKCLHKIKL